MRWCVYFVVSVGGLLAQPRPARKEVVIHVSAPRDGDMFDILTENPKAEHRHCFAGWKAHDAGERG
jgi:hypothetical protein